MTIKERIEELIIIDLINTKYPRTAKAVHKYRDEHFLNGTYDYLFEKFIEEYKLK